MHASLRIHPMPSRTIEQSHRPRVSDRTMCCHSSGGQRLGLLRFRKTMGAVTTANGTTGKNNWFSVSHAETKQNLSPGEDHSQSKSARSDSWAECRDKKSIGLEPKGRFFP